jgi:uncharacterized protein YjgD (DUF1641 family)
MDPSNGPQQYPFGLERQPSQNDEVQAKKLDESDSNVQSGINKALGAIDAVATFAHAKGDKQAQGQKPKMTAADVVSALKRFQKADKDKSFVSKVEDNPLEEKKEEKAVPRPLFSFGKKQQEEPVAANPEEPKPIEHVDKMTMSVNSGGVLLFKNFEQNKKNTSPDDPKKIVVVDAVPPKKVELSFSLNPFAVPNIDANKPQPQPLMGFNGSSENKPWPLAGFNFSNIDNSKSLESQMKPDLNLLGQIPISNPLFQPPSSFIQLIDENLKTKEIKYPGEIPNFDEKFTCVYHPKEKVKRLYVSLDKGIQRLWCSECMWDFEEKDRIQRENLMNFEDIVHQSYRSNFILGNYHEPLDSIYLTKQQEIIDQLFENIEKKEKQMEDYIQKLVDEIGKNLKEKVKQEVFNPLRREVLQKFTDNIENLNDYYRKFFVDNAKKKYENANENLINDLNKFIDSDVSHLNLINWLDELSVIKIQEEFVDSHLKEQLSKYLHTFEKHLQLQEQAIQKWDPIPLLKAPFEISTTLYQDYFEPNIVKKCEMPQVDSLYTGFESLYSPQLQFGNSSLCDPDAYLKLLRWTGMPYLRLNMIFKGSKANFNFTPLKGNKEYETKPIIVLIKSSKKLVFGCFSGTHKKELYILDKHEASKPQLRYPFLFSITRNKKFSTESQLEPYGRPFEIEDAVVPMKQKRNSSTAIVISKECNKHRHSLARLAVGNYGWNSVPEDQWESYLAGKKKFQIDEIEIFTVLL